MNIVIAGQVDEFFSRITLINRSGLDYGQKSEESE